jgi:NAD-dependent dihydropyrimidine dehydrogenase PreA subunit
MSDQEVCTDRNCNACELFPPWSAIGNKVKRRGKTGIVVTRIMSGDWYYLGVNIDGQQGHDCGSMIDYCTGHKATQDNNNNTWWLVRETSPC